MSSGHAVGLSTWMASDAPLFGTTTTSQNERRGSKATTIPHGRSCMKFIDAAAWPIHVVSAGVTCSRTATESFGLTLLHYILGLHVSFRSLWAILFPSCLCLEEAVHCLSDSSCLCVDLDGPRFGWFSEDGAIIPGMSIIWIGRVLRLDRLQSFGCKFSAPNHPRHGYLNESMSSLSYPYCHVW